MIGPSQALKSPAAQWAGRQEAHRHLTDPASLGRRRELLERRGMSTTKKPPTPRLAMKRITVRKIQPRSGVSAITPVASEKVRIEIVKHFAAANFVA